MKMKRIGGILIGTSALLASAFVLTSCGSNGVEFKAHQNEATQEEFEKGFESFLEEKKTTGYDLTLYSFSDSYEKKGETESKLLNESTHIETYDAITSVLYTYDKEDSEVNTPSIEGSSKSEIEKIYQTDDGLNTIINITAGTYTSLAYNASAAKTRKANIKFGELILFDYYIQTGDAYTVKYYIDDSVYTAVLTYDLSKDPNKEIDYDGEKTTITSATYEATLQFYGIDSEYFLGFEVKSEKTVNTTNASTTITTTSKDHVAQYARLFSVKQSIDKFDLTKYKKAYSSYAE